MDNVDQVTAYSVFFGDSPRGRQPDRMVVVSPSRDRWNDFGYKTRVEFDITSPAATFRDFPGHIGFLVGEEDRAVADASYLSELLASRDRSSLPAANVPAPFFTMLRSMAVYRELVIALGPDELRGLLLSLNDVVAAREYRTELEWFGEAVSSKVFAMSFTRSPETFFAFENAGPLLRGVEHEPFDVTSTSLATSITGRNSTKTELVFEFDQSAPLPKRIAVVIGKNGVGKSRTLSGIARTALHGRRTLRDADGSRFLFSRLLAFAPTNEAEHVFPVERRSAGSRVWYRRYSLNRSRRSKQTRYVTDLLVQVARSPQRIGRKSRWEIFLDAIEAIDGHREIVVPLVTADDEYVSLREFSGHGELRALETFAAIDRQRPPRRRVEHGVHEFSSGEISFLTFAAQVCLDIDNGALLLIDEPETHLHPQLISAFVSLLNSLLQMTGSVAILATHSVFVVREVFREQVIVLRQSAGGVVAERPTLRTFGADAGSIAYFVFGEDTPSSLAREVAENLLESEMSWDELYETYGDELSLEFLGELRERAERSEGSG